MKRAYSQLLVILVASTFISTASTVRPFFKAFLPPESFQLRLAFSSDQYPVLTSQFRQAAADWNAFLGGSGVKIVILAQDSTVTPSGRIYFNPSLYKTIHPYVYGQNEDFATYDQMGRKYYGPSSILKKYGGTENLTQYYRFKVDIGLNQGVPWESDPGTCYHIAVHELGHVLGLDHPNERGIYPVPDSTMNQGANSSTGKITPYDIDNVQYLYSSHDTQISLYQKIQAEAERLDIDNFRQITMASKYNKINNLFFQLTTCSYPLKDSVIQPVVIPYIQ